MRDIASWDIRPATPDDAGALALIGAATFLETYAGMISGPGILAHCAAHHSAAANWQLLGDGAQAWLAEARHGAAPLGYAMIGAPEVPAQPGDIQLKRIYALSPCHGSGMGVALLQAALAGAAGHARLLLGVYQRNARAIAFYQKHGFAPIGTRQFNVGGELYDDLILARSLAA